MNAPTKPNRLYQITLTNARPVRVSNEDWPVILLHDFTEIEPSGTSAEYHIRVRRHNAEDQQCIVYGWSLELRHDGGKRKWSGGYRCRLDQTASVLRAVGVHIAAPKAFVTECLTKLPPQII